MSMDTPFHALVPFGPTREPGLILMSAGGKMSFWDSLGMGLAGGGSAHTSELSLDEEERITMLTRADVRFEL